MNPMTGMDHAEKAISIDEHAWQETNRLHEHLRLTHDEAAKELEQLRTHRDQSNETFARHESALMERLAVCQAGLQANEPKAMPPSGSGIGQAYTSPASA